MDIEVTATIGKRGTNKKYLLDYKDKSVDDIKKSIHTVSALIENELLKACGLNK